MPVAALRTGRGRRLTAAAPGRGIGSARSAEAPTGRDPQWGCCPARGAPHRGRPCALTNPRCQRRRPCCRPPAPGACDRPALRPPRSCGPRGAGGRPARAPIARRRRPAVSRRLAERERQRRVGAREAAWGDGPGQAPLTIAATKPAAASLRHGRATEDAARGTSAGSSVPWFLGRCPARRSAARPSGRAVDEVPRPVESPVGVGLAEQRRHGSIPRPGLPVPARSF